MLNYRTLPLATAALLLGCGGAQTKTPVVTNSAEGKSTSASGDAAANRGTSLVRFVNALPGSGDLAITADKRDLFAGIGYQAVTQYLETSDNLSTFSLQAPGNGAELASNSETMTDGYRYTIVALSDEKGGASLRILRDELVADSGKARIRMIHAAPGLEDVDFVAQGWKDPIFNKISYSKEAGFKDVDPITATFEIRRDKGGARLVTVPKMVLTAGRSYTIILTGVAPDKLRIITFDDTVTPRAVTATIGAAK